MNPFFILLFLIALARRTWRLHKNSIIIRGIEAALAPKTQVVTLSRAERTASKTVIMEYQHKDQTYELILPARRRALGWTHCYATMHDGKIEDVTLEVIKKAGPMKDFFGVQLKPGQVYRGAVKLEFQDPKRLKTHMVLE